MKRALSLAKKAMLKNEVPVGAVIVKNGKIIASAHNEVIKQCDPTAHAEIIAIKKAAKILKNYRLNDTILYVTVEPCLMCVGAILHARIKEVVYGVDEPKFGASKLLEKEKVEMIKGILEEECRQLLQQFFKIKR
jgi:tRNA(adenine34) deaminase